MDLGSTALALLGLLLAAWTAGAAWLMIAAGARSRGADAARLTAKRLNRLLDEAPTAALLVRSDGRLEGSERLAHWLGLEELPQFLSELAKHPDRGLTSEQLDELTEKVRLAQKSAAPFRMAVTLPGSSRSLALRGSLADPQVSPGGAALIWVFDFSESERELAKMREETTRAKSDFAALVGLIQAAPMPMWFRNKDMRLQIVNQAYVSAVGAQSAQEVVDQQVELVEAVDGTHPGAIAQQASDTGEPIERIVSVTSVDGMRRRFRVSDLPLSDEGVAGYAVDIQEQEDQAREHRAYREAQRSMLDRLSVGVAQFDGQRRLTFANQPFRRLFAVRPGAGALGTSFERLLSDARDEGRTPEVRDFPSWRKEHIAWFEAGGTQDEDWPLSDGTHLSVVGQPMPDGGLALILEDRTEQLSIAANRDTLLRTRTAMLDSLFEALAVFAPDGTLQLWNHSFPETWGLEPEALDRHPSVDTLLTLIQPNLARQKQVKGVGEVIRSATLDRKERAGRLQMADGRTIEFAGIPLPDGNGLLTTLDVTANEQAETALRDRAEALEQADKVKTRFLANMSYEFRTPLTSIGGFAELLEAEVAGPLTDGAKEYVAAILESVARLTDQVENVLDLSQSEAGLLPIAPRELSLLAFVAGVARAREDAVEAKSITLDLKGSQSLIVSADPRQLGRAIGQLLDNAIEACGESGRILVDLGKYEDGVRIVISDDGRGMDEAELEHALDGMREASGPDTSRRQGLGLPLAKQLVEAHGGRFDIQSRKGEGTSVSLWLPKR
ncbi:PAS-domain containing protein [Alteriqipengyuania sp.]|uniref:PAS domain-containing sensor histidine kinase n=1 Tax=Alteriqipengyuania sp. TaxID=2800692 RepID=UPI0035122E7B